MSDDPFSPSVHEALALAVAAGAGNLAAAAAQRTAVADTLCALLGHELAVSHRLMMRLSAQVDGMIDDLADAKADGRTGLEAARLAGVVARLMERYRVGVMALHRLRGKDGVVERVVRLAWGIPEDEDSGSSGSGRGSSGAGRTGRDGGSGAAFAPPAPTANAAAARRGHLLNGNPSGDLAAAPRCGARTRAGGACRQPAMANGRCRFHGGLSRGPATPEGRARSRRARLTHGGRTAGVIALRAEAAASGRRLAALLDAAGRAAPAGHGVDRSDSPPRPPSGGGTAPAMPASRPAPAALSWGNGFLNMRKAPAAGRRWVRGGVVPAGAGSAAGWIGPAGPAGAGRDQTTSEARPAPA
jgi:hypothetical protein